MAGQTLRQRAYATATTLTTTSTELSKKAYSLPQMYAQYVATNASAVSQIESTLRNLTYLVPGARFHDSELASESLHSFIQLLSIYHDYVLKNRQTILTGSKSTPSPTKTNLHKPKQSNHARYTMFWSDNSSLYTKIATLLKITQYTELLWEMMARRRGGEKSRWRVVVLLESFKAICRLILLKLTNSRPLVNPPMPQREDLAPPEQEHTEALSDEELKMVHDADVFDAKDAFGEAGVPTPPMSESDKIPMSSAEPYIMPRTGLTLPALPTPDAISNYLLNHIITADDVKPAKQLLHRLASIQGQAAEVMYILRPVIYALLMQRVARQYGFEGQKWKKSWTPWLVGVSIEYMARAVAKRDLVSRAPGGAKSGLSALERDEFTKRGWNMTWWTMRGAFYENVTKKYIHGFAEKLRGKPILDLVGGVVEDYEFLWGNYYFSSSTM